MNDLTFDEVLDEQIDIEAPLATEEQRNQIKNLVADEMAARDIAPDDFWENDDFIYTVRRAVNNFSRDAQHE